MPSIWRISRVMATVEAGPNTATFTCTPCANRGISSAL